MKLTRITAENSAFFTGLCPEEMLSDRRTVKLGALSEENEPVSICIADIHDEKLRICWIYKKVVAENKKLSKMGPTGAKAYASLYMNAAKAVKKDPLTDRDYARQLSEAAEMGRHLTADEFRMRRILWEGKDRRS